MKKLTFQLITAVILTATVVSGVNLFHQSIAKPVKTEKSADNIAREKLAKAHVAKGINRGPKGIKENSLAGTKISQWGTGEVFVLYSNGEVKWMWNGGKKYGTWTVVSGNRIRTSIKGNTGTITEYYTVKGSQIYR